MKKILIIAFILYSIHSDAGILDCCADKPKHKNTPRSHSSRRVNKPFIRTAAAASLDPGAPFLINKWIQKYCTPDVSTCRLRNKQISSWELSVAEFPPYITHLDLSNNEISDIWSNTRFPPLLKHLVLNGNQIYRIKPNILPNSLEVLTLTSNGIQSFEDLPGIKELGSLLMLNLNGNKMQSFDGDLKEILPNALTYLMVNGNRMSHFESEIPSSLTVLDLKNNPLHSVLILNQAECEESLQVLHDPLLDINHENQGGTSSNTPRHRGTVPQSPVSPQSPRSSRATSQEIIQMLPRLIWSNMVIDRKCEICCEEFMSGEVITTLPCLHQYHCQCVTPWLKERETCPECRHNINVIDFSHFNN